MTYHGILYVKQGLMSCLLSCMMSCLLAYILPCILKCFVMSNLIYAFLICLTHFSSLAWLEVLQEPPILKVILGGCWRFLSRDLEDGVILEVLDHLGNLSWMCHEDLTWFGWDIDMCFLVTEHGKYRQTLLKYNIENLNLPLMTPLPQKAKGTL